eukprot:TRINITY_DN84061_c0_g1_i1.p1 TRINITY_DN84061_c0_g1~~TRINITY_DN84061_c0_g1_i1.p1  ORF type:complete len:176 (+),score=31.68 TRINITY_DN84061_c0_g1_i1:104-631(+)
MSRVEAAVQVQGFEVNTQPANPQDAEEEFRSNAEAVSQGTEPVSSSCEMDDLRLQLQMQACRVRSEFIDALDIDATLPLTRPPPPELFELDLRPFMRADNEQPGAYMDPAEGVREAARDAVRLKKEIVAATLPPPTAGVVAQPPPPPPRGLTRSMRAPVAKAAPPSRPPCPSEFC